MSRKHFIWIGFAVLLLILVAAASLWSLLAGEMKIPLASLPTIFENKSGMEYAILSNIRIPRLLLAFSIGGALSITGAILQGIYHNPLVEPYTLGISGGAALAVALVIVLGLNMSLGTLVIPAAGFTGAFITIFLVYFLAMKRREININRMLLIGVMISFVASSGMMFLMSISSADNLHSIIFWTMGSLDEPNTTLITVMVVSSLAGLIISMLFAQPLNALRLGEAKAKHLGINSSAVIRILFIIASLLTGLCVAVGGIIGFVGLIIPHILRSIIGSDYRILLISSFLGGSLFLIVCDIIARTIIAPNELPIGVITGMLGGSVFIIVLSRSKQKMIKQ
jgi:iron complex transport system permease protein